MALTLQFLGSRGTVTGSSFLLSDGITNLLIECGMFQGMEDAHTLNMAVFPFDILSIDAVCITHAHIDHVGRLPLLVQRGYSNPIYMTAATQALADLTLSDSAKIAQDDDPEMALYGMTDVLSTMQLIHPIPYHQPRMVGNFEIVFADAGHILGSASILVRYRGSKQPLDIVFSGDLGNSPQPLIRPTEHFGNADVVVMESTYGDEVHEIEDPKKLLHGEIAAIEQSGGALLVPSFSLERAQELLHYIDHMKREGMIDTNTQVFLDSPMAIKATQIFTQFRPLYNNELTKHAALDDPFDFPGLTMSLTGQQSRRIFKVRGPKVIIAGSGMMEGGRILNHAKVYLEDERNRLFFVGYQGEGTLGRHILEGAKSAYIDNAYVRIRAHVGHSSVFSAHADQQQLLHWLDSMNGVRQVYLVHGDGEARLSLSKLLTKHYPHLHVVSPTTDEPYQLV